MQNFKYFFNKEFCQKIGKVSYCKRRSFRNIRLYKHNFQQNILYCCRYIHDLLHYLVSTAYSAFLFFLQVVNKVIIQ